MPFSKPFSKTMYRTTRKTYFKWKICIIINNLITHIIIVIHYLSFMISNLHTCSPLFDGHKDLTVWKHTTFFLPYMVKYTLFTFIVAMEICIVTMETQV